MSRLLAVVLLALPAAAVQATQVVDDFESGTDPNNWSWLSGSPSNVIGNGVIQAEGGNPGAWFDSTAPYFAGHPNFTAVPAAGTPLRVALDSGTLHSASIDMQRLDTSSVENCHPVYDLPSTFTLQLFDLHTVGSDPPTQIEAHTTDGPASPGGTFPWTSASFTIPSDATDVPPGWVLNAPPELNYTWADLMHNIDGIAFFPISPEEITFDSCWELGADNVVVGYGEADDAIFADGFDIIPQTN
jgi:hypothetical protein